jgi:hypothetical protein
MRGPSAQLALPATLIGLLFAVGLIMHLLNEDFSVLCLSLTTLGVVRSSPCSPPVVAVRIVAGRNR